MRDRQPRPALGRPACERGARSRTGSVSIFLMMRRCDLSIGDLSGSLCVRASWSVETGILVRACATGRALVFLRQGARQCGQELSYPEVMISHGPPRLRFAAIPGHWRRLIRGAQEFSDWNARERTNRAFTLLLHLPRNARAMENSH